MKPLYKWSCPQCGVSHVSDRSEGDLCCGDCSTNPGKADSIDVPLVMQGKLDLGRWLLEQIKSLVYYPILERKWERRNMANSRPLTDSYIKGIGGAAMMSSKEKVLYILGALTGILGMLFFLSTSGPFNKAILESDISRFDELEWYELLFGFVSVGFFLFLILRSIVLPSVYLIAGTVKSFRSKRTRVKFKVTK
ncbi:hypothetical protein [Cohnella soli]|uniref:Uncharacterized protein n=1 Tax=Cohnella soli TaxID=425005 RepID=A0ABW0HTC6_9BACL